MGMLLKRYHETTSTDNTQRAVENTAPVVADVKETETAKPAPVKKAKAKKASRVEIMRMNVATVRAYAEEQGIEGANAMSGAELKRLLVNKMIEESE